jgi:hypothetical protein
LLEKAELCVSYLNLAKNVIMKNHLFDKDGYELHRDLGFLNLKTSITTSSLRNSIALIKNIQKLDLLVGYGVLSNQTLLKLGKIESLHELSYWAHNAQRPISFSSKFIQKLNLKADLMIINISNCPALKDITVSSQTPYQI